MAKEQYQKAANKKDLKEGCLLKIEPYCKSIVLAMVNGNVCDGFDILTWGEPLEVIISLFYLTKVAAFIVYDGAFFMSKTLLFGSYLSWFNNNTLNPLSCKYFICWANKATVMVEAILL